MPAKLKTIRSHTGYAQFLGECDPDSADSEMNLVVGYLPRHKLPAPSPYHYSPAHCVDRWNGKPVVCLEVSHRKYEIWEVDPRDTFATEEAATEAYIATTK